MNMPTFNWLFRFETPHALWLLLLIPLWWWAHRFCAREVGIRFPLVPLAARVQGKTFSVKILRSLRTAGAALLILAIARPQWGGRHNEVEASGVDIVLALDLSSSMLALDLSLSNKELRTRVDVAKQEIAEFIAKRPYDRMALIAFSGNAYLVSPLTLNHDWLLMNLSRLQVGVIDDGTAIGSALVVATNRLRSIPAKTRIIILLTDGDDNASQVSPLIAAEAAVNYGIKIYTIAVGKGGEVPTLFLNQQRQIARNAWGQPEIIRYFFPVDESSLKKIAEVTKGKFFRATDPRELQAIYEAIDSMEKTEVKLQRYEEYSDCFPWLLALALGCLALEWILAHTRYRRLP